MEGDSEGDRCLDCEMADGRCEKHDAVPDGYEADVRGSDGFCKGLRDSHLDRVMNAKPQTRIGKRRLRR